MRPEPGAPGPFLKKVPGTGYQILGMDTHDQRTCGSDECLGEFQDRQAAGGPLAWRLSAAAEGWPGTLEVLVPGQWPADDPEQIPAEPFSAAGFARHPCTAALADGLVFSVPETLPAGAFRLEAGCLLSPKRFHQISLLFNARQQLSRLELRRFSPPAG